MIRIKTTFFTLERERKTQKNVGFYALAIYLFNTFLCENPRKILHFFRLNFPSQKI